MNYIKIILLAGALFFVLAFIQKIAKRVLKRQANFNKYLTIYPIAEVFLWAIFFFYAINNLFEEKFYYATMLTSIIVVLVVIIAYFFLRDFIAGTVLKTEYNIKKGTEISFSGYSGIVRKMKYLSLEIETLEHEIISVPYSKINGKELKTIDSKKSSIKKFTFILTYKKTNDEIQDIKEKLLTKILYTPWALTGKTPDIKLINETKDNYNFEIYVYTQNENHFRKIKNKINKEFTA